jgi:hypothetical protein
VASFAVAGIQKYAEPQLIKVDWAEQQKQESYAWQWNAEYHPAARIWSAPPVQHFVQRIQQMGLMSAPGASKPESETDKPVQTASRVPKLALPADPRRDIDTTGVDPEMAATVDAILNNLQAAGEAP